MESCNFNEKQRVSKVIQKEYKRSKDINESNGEINEWKEYEIEMERI